MRIGSTILIFCLLAMLILLAACKKEAGPGGKNTVSGTVVYKNGVSGNNDAASNATVSIAYGASGSTSEFEQIILTEASGKFSIGGLRKGSYFIKAGYTDAHGFVYNTPGAVIELKNKKSNLEVNMVLE